MRISVWAAGLLVFLPAHAAYPDTFPYSPPIPDPQGIVLKSQTVTIELSRSEMNIEAVFTLENTNPAEVTLKIAFPAPLFKPLENFEVQEDGHSVPTEYVRTHYTSDHVWSSHFPVHYSKTVRVRYAMGTWRYSGILSYLRGKKPDRGRSWYDWNRVAWYQLTSGAWWQGPIGQAEITVRLNGIPESAIAWIRPEGAVVENGSIHWLLKNFEPDSDIIVSYEPAAGLPEDVTALVKRMRAWPYGPDYVSTMARKYRQTSQPKEADRLEKALPEWRDQMVNLARRFDELSQPKEAILVREAFLAWRLSGAVEESKLERYNLQLMFQNFFALAKNFEQAGFPKDARRVRGEAVDYARSFKSAQVYVMRQRRKLKLYDVLNAGDRLLVDQILKQGNLGE